MAEGRDFSPGRALGTVQVCEGAGTGAPQAGPWRWLRATQPGTAGAACGRGWGQPPCFRAGTVGEKSLPGNSFQGKYMFLPRVCGRGGPAQTSSSWKSGVNEFVPHCPSDLTPPQSQKWCCGLGVAHGPNVLWCCGLHVACGPGVACPGVARGPGMVCGPCVALGPGVARGHGVAHAAQAELCSSWLRQSGQMEAHPAGTAEVWLVM